MLLRGGFSTIIPRDQSAIDIYAPYLPASGAQFLAYLVANVWTSGVTPNHNPVGDTVTWGVQLSLRAPDASVLLSWHYRERLTVTQYTEGTGRGEYTTETLLSEYVSDGTRLPSPNDSSSSSIPSYETDGTYGGLTIPAFSTGFVVASRERYSDSFELQIPTGAYLALDGYEFTSDTFSLGNHPSNDFTNAGGIRVAIYEEPPEPPDPNETLDTFIDPVTNRFYSVLDNGGGYGGDGVVVYAFGGGVSTRTAQSTLSGCRNASICKGVTIPRANHEIYLLAQSISSGDWTAFRSDDDARSWTMAGVAWTDSHKYARMRTLEDGRKITIALNDASGDFEFKLGDVDGATWGTTVVIGDPGTNNKAPDLVVRQGHIEATNGYDAIWRSNDTGQTWSAI
jgi:hypothetical protein